jgi:hypothetical protein
MVSIKFLIALVPLALTATALPGSSPASLEARACYPPSGCTLVGECDYCCASAPGGACHADHEAAPCPVAGQTRYHCDDQH